MKLSSLEALLEKSFTSLIRFPLVFLAAVAGSYFAIRIADLAYSDSPDEDFLMRNIMTASLALTLFLSVKIYGERKNFPAKIEALLHVFPVALVVLYYISLPSVLNTYTTIQFVLFNIALHLLVAIAPFFNVHEPNGFWQYNKALLLRFLTAALYSAVLYIGLSLALLAIDQLLEIKIDSKWYFRLWVFIAGIVNTWIFLAGIPHHFQELDKVTDYPKGLKIFTQYILLPIIMVYMLILYVYEIKILVTSHWIVGWVSYLVLAFSITGILSLLLIWPIRETTGSGWIKSYSRFFYMALFPLIAMLFVAIFKRVMAYGITENRYFIIVLAVWLTFIALYFILSTKKNIKLIPLTLCIIAFLASFGPWGAFSISKNSQYKRLYSLLEENNILKEGKVHKAEKQVSLQDGNKITSIVAYMVKVHGVKSIQPLFAEKLQEAGEASNGWTYRSRYDMTNDLVEKMGINPGLRYGISDTAEREKTFSYSVNAGNAMDIKGYDILFKYARYHDKDSVVKTFYPASTPVTVIFNSANSTFKLFAGRTQIFSLNMDDLAGRLQKKGSNNDKAVNPELMTVEQSAEGYKTKIIFETIEYAESKNKAAAFHALKATIMLKKE